MGLLRSAVKKVVVAAAVVVVKRVAVKAVSKVVQKVTKPRLPPAA